MSLTEKLRRGEIVAIDGKLYALCSDCGSVIRINKPLFGALHFCVDVSERE